LSTLVGLSGYAQVGKDTVGRILTEKYGFERVSFADKLREVALAIDPLIDAVPGEERNQIHTMRLGPLVQQVGWEKAKQWPEVRRLLQVIGTDAGRAILGDNVWVDAAFKPLQPAKKYVFTDVRFPNEATAIRENGGILLRIERPGYGPVNNHPSETALDDSSLINMVIFNNRDLHSLEVKVVEALRWFNKLPSIDG
jgi:hypothetical protein